MAQDPFRDVDSLLVDVATLRRAHPWTDDADALLLDASAALRKLRELLIYPSCARCGAAITTEATGRPRRYCSDTCRQASNRERHRPVVGG